MADENEQIGREGVVRSSVVAYGNNTERRRYRTRMGVLVTPLTEATVGEALTFTPSVDGGSAPHTFAIGAGALPTGLLLNPATGQISGTPTVAGTYRGIQLKAIDSVGRVALADPFDMVVS